jgi:hypothetical protein
MFESVSYRDTLWEANINKVNIYYEMLDATIILEDKLHRILTGDFTVVEVGNFKST